MPAARQSSFRRRAPRGPGSRARTQADGLKWGPLRLPALPLAASPGAFAPDWGDDGRLGFAIFERCHAFIDMPQRWTYLKPLD